MIRVSRILPLVLLPLALACGGGNKEAPAEAPKPAGKPVDTATAATVSGKVVLEGTPPKAEVIKMASDPICMRENGGQRETEIFVVGPNNELRNVVVYLKEAPAGYAFDAPSQPVTLDQQGCRYDPHVFAVRVGQAIDISNSDATLHNVHAIPKVNQEFNIGQPIQGMKMSHTFTAPEIGIPFKCDVHGWMNAWAAVFDHPYYDVTDGNGQFSLKSLPPGTYQIEAWHEKLGTTSQTVTIGPHETKALTFAFKVS